MSYLMLLIAFLLFLSGLDDLVLDLFYLLRGRKGRRRLRMQELSAAPSQRIAVLIPAWQEGDVIGQMLMTTLSLVNYPRSRYHLFVGTYKNDPDTQAAVDAVAARYPNVHKVVGPRPGPTTKGDNLNQLYAALQAYETRVGRSFDIVILHDAEDLIHPTSFKLFNYLIPGADMVQIPVLPIQPEPTLRNLWRNLTSGSYADEFAENHLRHMLAREWLGGFIPSAGVGTALARSALDKLAAEGAGLPFATGALTEDYEMALRLLQQGCRTVYFLEGVERIDEAGRVRVEYNATRELFPNEFELAVRQKTRWIYGITMQTAARIRWRQPGPRYLLLRDLKGKFANLLTLPAYLVTLTLLGAGLFGLQVSLPTGLQRVLGILLWANGFFLLERQVGRFLALRRAYGLREAALATLLPPLVPVRYIWGSIINLAATVRAWRLHFTGSPGAKRHWAKTAHRQYVPAALLAAYRRQLGDLLLEQGLVAPDALEGALATQRESRLRLGELLVARGYLRAEELQAALAALHHTWRLASGERVWEPRLAGVIPHEVLLQHQVLPLLAHGGQMVVSAAEPLSGAAREALGHAAGLAVWEVLAPPEEIRRGLEQLAIGRGTGGPRLGTRLLEEGLIHLPELVDALQEQGHSGRPIGQVLVELGHLSAQALDGVLASAQG